MFRDLASTWGNPVAAALRCWVFSTVIGMFAFVVVRLLQPLSSTQSAPIGFLCRGALLRAQAKVKYHATFCGNGAFYYLSEVGCSCIYFGRRVAARRVILTSTLQFRDQNSCCEQRQHPCSCSPARHPHVAIAKGDVVESNRDRRWELLPRPERCRARGDS